VSAPSQADLIRWRLHLASAPERVFEMLATAAGRRRFWAESADEVDGAIRFRFPGGVEWTGRILARVPPARFAVEYFGGSRAEFTCSPDGAGGTDLVLTETGVPPHEWAENHAGWVSVLLTLKAAADFGVDLRNHDSRRTWADGYVDP
jgi:uncharacterized protein YndB with AHSA1/START domain